MIRVHRNDQLIRALRPEFMNSGISGPTISISEGPGIDIVVAASNNQIGLGGDTVLLYKTNGNPVAEFASTSAGIMTAVAAAVSGDTIVLPSRTIALTGALTLPTGVALVGLSDKSIINASSFSGTAITMAADAVCRGFTLSFVSNGTTALGIDARFIRAKVIDMTVTASGGSATNIAVELGVNADGPGVLSVHGTSPGVTHTEAARWSVGAGSGGWHGAGFRLTVAPTYNGGWLVVTIEIESGSIPGGYHIKLMESNDPGNSGVNPGISPTWTGNTSGPPGPLTGTVVMLGSGTPWPGTDCYFVITSGYGALAYTARITKIEWRQGYPNIIYNLWEEGSGIQDVPYVVLCKLTATGTAASALTCDVATAGIALHSDLNGDVYDIDATGILHVYGNRYSHSKVNNTPVQDSGDRSAWDVSNYATSHASDINAAIYLHHLTAPSVAGNIMIDTGTSWNSVPANANVPFAPTARGDMIVANVTPVWNRLALGGSVGSFVTRDANDVLWSTLTLPNAATTGDILYATGANAIGNRAAVAVGQVLVSAGVATAPAWSAYPSVTGTATSKQAAAAGIGLDHNSATGNFTLWLSPANLTASRRMIFPDYDTTWPAADSAGVLTSDGAGALSWGAGTPPSAHDILSASHGDTLAAGVLDGSIIIGNVTPNWSALAISIPAANVRNVLGIDNGELRPSWKTVLDATNPTTIGIADAGGPGTSLVLSHRDHQHPSPATWTAAAHTIDGATHTVAGRTAGQVIIATAAATFGWSTFMLSGTAGGSVNFAVTDTKILTFTATDTYTITVAGTASVIGTNTGDVTLASPNHGLGLTNQVITLGTPSTVTSATTNAVTTTTHSHAITGAPALLGNGTAAGQIPITGATPFAPAWSTLLFPNAATKGDIPYASAINTIGMLAGAVVDDAVLQYTAGLTNAPHWSTGALLLYTGSTLTLATGGSFYANVTNTKTLTLISTGDFSLTIPGTGTAVVGTAASFPRLAVWSDANTLAAGMIVPPASNVLTLLNSAASTLSLAITAGKTLTFTAVDNLNLTMTGGATTLGFGATGCTYTFPNTAGTVALLNVSNVFTIAQYVDAALAVRLSNNLGFWATGDGSERYNMGIAGSGGFQFQSTDSGTPRTFNVVASGGACKFSVAFETGATTVGGDLTVSGTGASIYAGRIQTAAVGIGRDRNAAFVLDAYNGVTNFGNSGADGSFLECVRFSIPTLPTQYFHQIYSTASGGGATLNALKFSICNNTSTGHVDVLIARGDSRVGIVNMSPSYTLDVTGNLRCSTGFGCNGATPQTAYSLGAASSDLATVIALANKLRTMAINDGTGSA